MQIIHTVWVGLRYRTRSNDLTLNLHLPCQAASLCKGQVSTVKFGIRARHSQSFWHLLKIASGSHCNCDLTESTGPFSMSGGRMLLYFAPPWSSGSGSQGDQDRSRNSWIPRQVDVWHCLTSNDCLEPECCWICWIYQNVISLRSIRSVAEHTWPICTKTESFLRQHISNDI